jgi:glycosyltransferase involved in cell wall biosynthesis
LKVKGVGLLLDAARLLPAIPFLLIGIDERLLDAVSRNAPANVEVRGRVDRGQLLALYRRAQVYCQPSMIEGLPGAVCEAMLCGCIPVGTDVGGMRTAIDDAGFLVPPGDAPRLADGILKAMASLPGASVKARDAIAPRFTRERREEGLRRVIGDLLT